VSPGPENPLGVTSGLPEAAVRQLIRREIRRPQTGSVQWERPAFTNSWTDSSGVQLVQFCYRDNVCRLRGWLKNTGGGAGSGLGAVAFVLPKAPLVKMRFPLPSVDAAPALVPGLVEVRVDGSVVPVFGDTRFEMYLDSISFRVGS
jgi:hypothetical protein